MDQGGPHIVTSDQLRRKKSVFDASRMDGPSEELHVGEALSLIKSTDTSLTLKRSSQSALKHVRIFQSMLAASWSEVV